MNKIIYSLLVIVTLLIIMWCVIIKQNNNYGERVQKESNWDNYTEEIDSVIIDIDNK